MLEELQRKVESVEMKLKEKESCVVEVCAYIHVTAKYLPKKPVQLPHSKYISGILHALTTTNSKGTCTDVHVVALANNYTKTSSLLDQLPFIKCITHTNQNFHCMQINYDLFL